MHITRTVKIRVQDGVLFGSLSLPEAIRAVILFAHGNDSGRMSPRNRFVAAQLNRAGFATLLIDMLTADEEAHGHLRHPSRFDQPLLARRLCAAMEWLQERKDTQGLPIGLFGANAGSAAALIASTDMRRMVTAIVSRSGRPDLAEKHLPLVHTPTLFIVGANDKPVIELNEMAMSQMVCEHKLEIVKDAGHLFEEPGTLENVSALAIQWYLQYMRAAEMVPPDLDHPEDKSVDNSLDQAAATESNVVVGDNSLVVERSYK